MTEGTGVEWRARRAALKQLCLEELFEISLFVGITPSVVYCATPPSSFTRSNLKLSQ